MTSVLPVHASQAVPPKSALKKVLFVTYGGGHVKMVVPVAQALEKSGLAHGVVLALTTAAPVVAEAGLEMLQFKDFVTADDAPALLQGKKLMADLQGSVADETETAAYLGLCYADLIAEKGLAGARAAYQTMGRQAFLPVATLERILKQCAPDLVVVTNSPRAERAAALAARRLQIPVVCIVDLFALDEVKWIGAPDYADQVCVLNESVRQFLMRAGRHASQITVTGNPGFDALFDPHVADQVAAVRQRMKAQGRRVILWPSVIEPDVHPFNGRPGNPALPLTVLKALIAWTLDRDDCVLCIRPRPGETLHASLELPDDERLVVTGQEWSLASLLHATDLVVTINSTVGLEGRLVGARVIQVSGSVLDDALPLQSYGLADETVSLAGLEAALNRQLGQIRHGLLEQLLATTKVLDVLRAYL